MRDHHHADTELTRVADQLRVRLRQQAAVADLGQRALMGTDLSTLMDEAVVLVAQTLGVEYSKVLELLPDGKDLLLRAGVGWKEGYAKYATVGAGTDSQAGYTLMSSEPVIVEDLRTETRFSGPPLLNEHAVISGLSVIIHGPDRPFGILGAHSTRRRVFNRHDVHFLQAVANVLATAIGRRRVEEAICETKAFYEQLVGEAGDAIVVLDRDGAILTWNKGAERMFGWAAQEVLGHCYFALQGEDVAEEIEAILQRVLNGASFSNLEMRRRRKDGRWFDALLTVSPVHNSRGEVIAAQGIVKDITERKRAENALRESEERFRKIFEEGPLGMAVVDVDYRFVRVNNSLCRMLGYSEQELTGMTFPEITHPEDIGKDLALSENIFSGQIPHFHLEKRYLKKTGEILWIALTACVIRDEEGKALYGLAMIEDITTRKRAEETLRKVKEELEDGVRERTAQLSEAISVLEEQIAERKKAEAALHASREHFRKLVETVNAIPWEADLATWRFTYVGPQAVRILGYSLDDWFADDFWINHIHPEDREYATRFCLEGAAKRQEFEFEYRMLAADGHVVWMHDLVTVVTGEGGLELLRGFMLDITERKRAEEQLKNSREVLRALSARLLSVQEQERSRIAREVHDQLGQVLTSLKIDLAWLDQKLPGSQQKLHEKIRNMTHMVDTTVQAVRRISTELRPGILDHLGLVATLEWQAREFQDRTGIACVFTRNPEDILVDAMRSTTLFRICQEALTNIARHANATRVGVNLKKVGADLVLDVRDDGRGISRTAVADPKSLGLIGMRERVLPWGGDVRIRGVRGKGTVVTVRIPVKGGEKHLPAGIS